MNGLERTREGKEGEGMKGKEWEGMNGLETYPSIQGNISNKLSTHADHLVQTFQGFSPASRRIA